jgi:hypothetical protein
MVLPTTVIFIYMIPSPPQKKSLTPKSYNKKEKEKEQEKEKKKKETPKKTGQPRKAMKKKQVEKGKRESYTQEDIQKALHLMK